MATNNGDARGSKNSGDNKLESHRPNASKFKQQNLPAWQPIFTATSVIPAFFIVGAVFIPLGVILLITSQNLTEFRHDYTHCLKKNDNNKVSCVDYLKELKNTGKTCNCQINASLEHIGGNVYIYYGLTNYHQNHRRYVRSRDDEQLHGSKLSPTSASFNADCDPYKTLTINGSTYGYAPCGAIANSLFNDTFEITYQKSGERVNLLKTKIAWKSDKQVKFNNPESWASFTKPRNWKAPAWELDTTDKDNNGYNNEDLIVWMRTAALPSFRKLFRRVDRKKSKTFRKGLPKGIYTIDIQYNYPVDVFGGTKSIIISNTSWMGGKNPFLGISYLCVGSLSVLLAVMFLFIHFKVGKKKHVEHAVSE